MKNALLFVLLALSFQTKAQTVEASTTIPINDYLDLLATNLEIPEEVSKKYENSSIDITFILTITKTGSVFNPKIQNDSLQLESNLKKAIEKLPKWNPKTEDSVAVVSRKAFNLSIFVPNKEVNTSNNQSAIPEQGMQKYFHNIMRRMNIEKYLDDNEATSEIKMIATFIVEKDGSLKDIKIKESNEPSLNREVVRVIKSMPKWKPATENGVPVRSDFTLPIKIKINK